MIIILRRIMLFGEYLPIDKVQKLKLRYHMGDGNRGIFEHPQYYGEKTKQYVIGLVGRKINRPFAQYGVGIPTWADDRVMCQYGLFLLIDNGIDDPIDLESHQRLYRKRPGYRLVEFTIAEESVLPIEKCIATCR